MSRRITVLVGTGIKDEEDWTGFLLRQSAVSSLDGYHGLTVVLGTPSHKAAFVHPPRMAQTASLFPGLVTTWTQNVLMFTRYRLNSAFLSEDGKAKLLEHHGNGGQPGASGLIGMNRWGGRARLAVCLSCVEEDRTAHGFAVWRRLHLMSSVLYCPTHEEPLRTFCRLCDKGHRRGTETWTPRSICLCGKPLLKVASFRNRVSVRAAIGIARMADEVLKGHVDTTGFAKHTGPVIRAAYWRRAQEWHVGHRELAVDHIRRSLGTELCAALQLGQTTLVRMAGRRTTLGTLRNPMQNIASIWSHFGEWDAFTGEVRSRQACPETYDEMARPQIRRIRPEHTTRGARRAASFRQMSSDELEGFREHVRKTLLAALASNPNTRRSDVQKLPNGARYYGFVLEHDREWFDEVFPLRRGRVVHAAIQSGTEEQDTKLAQRVLHRYRKTLRTKPEAFITRAFLLDNTVMESVARDMRKPSPKLDAMLESCVDDFESWTKRQVKHITKAVRRIDKTCRWADAKSFEAPNRRGVRLRLNMARAWLQENGE